MCIHLNKTIKISFHLLKKKKNETNLVYLILSSTFSPIRFNYLFQWFFHSYCAQHVEMKPISFFSREIECCEEEKNYHIFVYTESYFFDSDGFILINVFKWKVLWVRVLN